MLQMCASLALLNNVVLSLVGALIDSDAFFARSIVQCIML